MNINDIRDALRLSKPIEYSVHCQKRMLERGILRKDILECIEQGEIIENYPLSDGVKNDRSLPSCLVLGYRSRDHKAVHVVVGYNGDRVLIISACYPDKEHWLDDNTTRRV